MRVSIAVVWALFLALAFGCALPKEFAYSGPDAEGYVATEVASLPSDGTFTYDVETFTDARAAGSRRVVSPLAEIAVADRSDDSNLIDLSDTTFGLEGPASESTLGGGKYAVLNGAARIALAESGTVLGAHVCMSVLGVREHQALYAGTAMTACFTGRSTDGSWTPTIRVEIAAYDGRGFYFTDRWTWIDLSGLGPVTELLVDVETPLSEQRGIEPIATALLIDNLTLSSDYHPDTDYFTVALVPGIGSYTDEPAILDSLLSYLTATRRTEELTLASFFGGLVADPNDEEQWQSVGEALVQLPAELPFGVSLAPSDYIDAERPEEGSPLYLDAVPERRLWNRAWWGDRSDDELSSWQLVDTDLGEIMFLHLAVDTPLETLEWAQEAIDDHPHTPVVVVVDRYMDGNRRYSDVEFPMLLDAVSPDDFFTTFVRANPGIFLIVCSDQDDRIQMSRHRTGSPIIELSVSSRPAGPEEPGYVKLLRFYANRHELRLAAFSPWLNEYRYDPEQAQVIPIDFENTIP